jgi:hypothetical protein
MNNHQVPGVDPKLCETAYGVGLSCLSKDQGRTWKWGMADKDGWPGTDDEGWAWQEWTVDPIEAMRKLHEKLTSKKEG